METLLKQQRTEATKEKMYSSNNMMFSVAMLFCKTRQQMYHDCLWNYEMKTNIAFLKSHWCGYEGMGGRAIFSQLWDLCKRFLH